VGFAAETEELERNARAKLERKGADFLVANDVSRSDIAFERTENEVTVFRRKGPPVFFSRRPKSELAASLFDLFAATLSGREHTTASPR
jgi:phosphopantothenoylcysteine decarboxylase/phosphopantothenate--cysteine ligase